MRKRNVKNLSKWLFNLAYDCEEYEDFENLSDLASDVRLLALKN